ncbi:hypothetical protein LY78DRAFT_592566 [Colletotrichum sublineola]|nr:hypothetical protein LY78DRAFT_592566 [Colletotrichum sublineola]
MHASAVLFTSLYILATSVVAEVCCNSGIEDPSGRCKDRFLDAFCCTNIGRDADSGSGCDGFAEFPTGRKVVDLVTSSTCKSGTISGFIGCVPRS